MNSTQENPPPDAGYENDVLPQTQSNIMPWLLLIIVIIIGSGAVAGMFIHTKATLRRVKAEIPERLSIAIREKDTAENEVAALTRLVTDQHRDLSEINNYRRTFKVRQNTLKLENEKLIVRVENLEREKANLRRERDDFREKFKAALKEMDSSNTPDLERVLADQQKDIAELRKYLEKVKAERNDLMLQHKALVRIGIINDSLEGDRNTPDIQAVVVGYKKDISLIVIDAGEIHGIREGHKFAIFDRGNFVAQAEVEKVLPRFCGCHIIYSQSEIKEGMQATTRLY
ncbi:MAG: hypothetical protein ACYS8W_06590 [Planctomycetota bacterium]|jgi:hypothetical protein